MEGIFIEGLLFGGFSKWSPQLYERYYRRFGSINKFGIEYEPTGIDFRHLKKNRMKSFSSSFKFSRFSEGTYKRRCSEEFMLDTDNTQFEMQELFSVNCPKRAYREMKWLMARMNAFGITKFGGWHANYQVKLNYGFNKNNFVLTSPQGHHPLVKQMIGEIKEWVKRRHLAKDAVLFTFQHAMAFEHTCEFSCNSLYLKDTSDTARIDSCRGIYRLENKYFPQCLTPGHLLLAAYLDYSKDTRMIDYVHRNMDRYGILFDPVDFVSGLVDDNPRHPLELEELPNMVVQRTLPSFQEVIDFHHHQREIMAEQSSRYEWHF